jgi:hypothetical protein
VNLVRFSPWYADLAKLLEASVFEHGYAEASGITVRQLRQWGRFPEPCGNCDYTVCHGWKMGHQWEDAIFEDMEREGKCEQERVSALPRLHPGTGSGPQGASED